MNYKIIYTKTAIDDLRKLIFDILVLTKDQDTAYNYVNDIQNKINILKTYPNSGSLPKDRVLISKGYRFLIYKKYLIFYFVDSDKEKVYIASIFSSKRDYTKAMIDLI